MCKRYGRDRMVAARRAFSMADLLAAVIAVTLLLFLCVPGLGRMRQMSGIEGSLNNLAVMGIAHALYATDWNDRQYTNIVDDISTFGNSPAQAIANYESVTGEPHPGVVAGWADGVVWGWWPFMPSMGSFFQPIDFGSGPFVFFGLFRVPNVKPYHGYLNGRFYDPGLYAPNDTAVIAAVEPLFAGPSEFNTDGNPPLFSSYCFSPAAMFDPQVMRAPSAGGWQDPWDLPTGFTSPPLSAVQFPDLKTHMMEHHWVQAPPAECNPAFGDEGTYNGCEPYYFNHGLDSAPATLFYDGSTRLLPNTEVQASDQAVLKQTGGVDGLWSRDTPFGQDGYFLDVAFDPAVDVSHHVLTTDGILGRDTLGPGVKAGVFNSSPELSFQPHSTVELPGAAASLEGVTP